MYELGSMNHEFFKNVILAQARIFFTVALFFSYTSFVEAQVSINEFSPNSSPEWIEFYNASESAEYIRDYYVDDDTSFIEDSGSSGKKTLSGLVTANVTYPHIELNSFLNNSGDFVVLFDPQGIIVDQYQYSDDPGDGVTIGRSPDKTGNFFTLTASTKSGPNAQPVPPPSPTPSSAPSPHLEPTLTPELRISPTPLVTPKASFKPSVSVKQPSPSIEVSSEVLGEADLSPSPVISLSPQEATNSGGTSPIGLLFVGMGILFSGAAGFLVYKKIEVPKLV